jgi:hypothetical protein
MAPMDNVAWSSVSGVQLTPAVVVFQTPPPAVAR